MFPCLRLGSFLADEIEHAFQHLLAARLAGFQRRVVEDERIDFGARVDVVVGQHALGGIELVGQHRNLTREDHDHAHHLVEGRVLVELGPLAPCVTLHVFVSFLRDQAVG